MLAGNVQATACYGERIYWARTSSEGKILLYTTFGLLLSSDHGKTWSMVEGPVDGSPPVEAGPALVTAFSNRDRPRNSPDAGLYRSIDFGLTWSRIGDARGAFAAGPAGTVYACDERRAQVERYTPSTGSWSKTALLEQDAHDSSTCREVRVDGSNVWVRGSSRMFHSTNNGASWTATIPPQYLGKSVASAMHADGAGLLYATGGFAEESHLIRSDDAGATWTSSRPSYPPGMAPKYERLVGGQDRTLYVLGGHRVPATSTEITTLYRVSGDKTETLFDIPTPLLSTPKAPLHIAADGSMSYATYSSVWVSLAGGKNWREIPGHTLTKKPWLVCDGRIQPVQ